jgi:hypothetical protein
MLAVLQTTLSPETPHIGAGEPFFAIFFWAMIAVALVATAIHFLWGRHSSPAPTEGEWEELLAGQALGVDDPHTDEAYAEVQARCRAAGVDPP